MASFRFGVGQFVAGVVRLREDRVGEELNLDGAGGPAAGFADGGEGMAVEWRRPVLAEGFQMIGRGIAFVAGQAILIGRLSVSCHCLACALYWRKFPFRSMY